MGLTSALNVSLSGLTLNETAIDVIGNNIANAGTTGFKASKVLFSTQLANTISFGSRPKTSASDSTVTINGGTNPKQIGLGAQVASISVDYSQGGVTATTSPSDLAIQGEGFFILDENGTGNPVYTRNGNLRLDSANYVSNAQGLRVLGYGVDTDFNLVTTTLSTINVRLGEQKIAQQTRTTKFSGALSPTGTVATQGTLQTSAAITNNLGAAATGTTLLTAARLGGDLVTPVFANGDTLSFAPTKGGRTMDTSKFNVTATSTVADLMAFFDQSIGIENITYSGANVEPDGVQPGVSINGTGQIQIKGNRGTVNDFTIPVGALVNQSGSSINLPFTKSQTANGESTVSAFTIYDSLGTPITARITSWLDAQSTTETKFHYTIESADQKNDETSGANKDIFIGSGDLRFDNLGRLINTDAGTFTLNRYGTAAVQSLVFTADFNGVSGISSTGSSINLTNQDGTSPGTLTSYVIDD